MSRVSELISAILIAQVLGHAPIAQIAVLAVVIATAVIALVRVAPRAVALALRNHILHARLVVASRTSECEPGAPGPGAGCKQEQYSLLRDPGRH